MEPRFVLTRDKVLEQYNQLRELGVKVSYSYKTNREVGNVLQEVGDCEFSIHDLNEIDMIENKKKIWFFAQAWERQVIQQIVERGVSSFVIDNEKDLSELLDFLIRNKVKVNLLLRMKFQEHRITSGRYFTYGMSARKINEIIHNIEDNQFIDKIGVHIHRKSQNASEWEILEELRDSLSEESLERINIINLGGGLPIKYKTYTAEILPYIFKKIEEVKKWLDDKNTGEKEIEIFVEPGRFIAGPAVKLEAEIIQIVDRVIVINTSIYNCALDSVITNIRMLIEGELREDGCEKGEGEYYMIKGNSPTRDDIFRYKVKLRDPKVGDRLVFLNAGAYNYTTDFCGLKKLKTEIVGV